MIAPMNTPLFDLGRVVATRAALQAIDDSGQNISEFLDRHVHGDWGAVFIEDDEKNRVALLTGQAIRSVYRTDNGVKVWIVTEAADRTGRRSTSILLPGEA
jgi:hypothetical protein